MIDKYRLLQGMARRLRVLLGRLRALRHRLCFVKIGRSCSFGSGVAFIYGWKTRFGNNCIVDSLAEFKCPTSQNVNQQYNIDIGDNVFIGRGTIFDSNISIKVGRDTLIAPYCFITDTGHLFEDVKCTIQEQGCTYEEVEIGANVWIGAHVVIISGVTIGEGSVVGANSTVTKNIPPYAIAYGSPARIVKYRHSDNRHSEET
jgi:acetyltransferase-like isoleucine patch superfamily enzyme